MIEFRKKLIVVLLVALLSILAIGLGLGFGLAGRKNVLREIEKEIIPPLKINKSSTLGTFLKAAISTDSAGCAPIGL
jgi:hypothetical protein